MSWSQGPPSASSVPHYQPSTVRRAIAEFLRGSGAGVSDDERIAPRRAQQTFIDLRLQFIGIDQFSRNRNIVEVDHRPLEIANTSDFYLQRWAAFFNHGFREVWIRIIAAPRVDCFDGGLWASDATTSSASPSRATLAAKHDSPVEIVHNGNGDWPLAAERAPIPRLKSSWLYFPICDHESNLLKICDIQQRVFVNDQQVRELACFDRTDFLIHAHCLSRPLRCGLDDLHRRQFHVFAEDLHFVVNSQPG